MFRKDLFLVIFNTFVDWKKKKEKLFLCVCLELYLPTALCLLFSTSSSFRFSADSVSDLEPLSEFTSLLVTTDALLDDSAVLLLELWVVGWSCAELLDVALLLQREPVRSRSASESSRLWQSSELDSCIVRLSLLLLSLLGDGELGVGVAALTNGGSSAWLSGAGSTVRSSTVTLDFVTLVRWTGVGASVEWPFEVWGTGGGEMSEFCLKIKGGGGGAFFLFCWLSETRPTCQKIKQREQGQQ